ncbi:hypothetical protein RFM68_15345 [Mesorhizobium sp. MSK_1335]|uniref:General secretion pathway protein GspN n=1 Tax=Mesorhizobium montanum TaxID=3072323 RepID=A0ABU4ZKJ9_9HYPH|nr:hypothetical protein [Mesorhizobium sp. MSK_1335]MDX8525887.1 hypothetical protein [Mesorhizobium sp. MSK_1335]
MIRLVAALGLGVAAGALALTNVALYETPVDISPTAPSAQRNMRELQAGTTGLPAAADSTGFAETFARPLFTPTRRKFIPVAEGAPQAQVASDPIPPAQPVASAPPAPAPALLGISINGAGARVLLKAAGTEQANWYGSGETVDGWTVSAVDKDAATLQRDGKAARILLYPPAPPATPAGGGDGL